MPGACCGTDGSNPVPSSGESSELLPWRSAVLPPDRRRLLRSVGAGPAGPVPAGNPVGATSYATAATPSVQELRELMELKRELTQMYQQQQKALIAQTAAEQR